MKITFNEPGATMLYRFAPGLFDEVVLLLDSDMGQFTTLS